MYKFCTFCIYVLCKCTLENQIKLKAIMRHIHIFFPSRFSLTISSKCTFILVILEVYNQQGTISIVFYFMKDWPVF